MCNGSGVCRKSLTGTMCPSFMVTHDEEHSTRGRANALRLALSGQLPEGSLTSERMHDVMDLCLMCKGCKAECPSNVDVAKLKVEFLAHYHQQHRPSLGSVLMANVAWLNRIGSALAPASNWLAAAVHAREVTRSVSEGERRSVPRVRFGLMAAASEWLTGVDRRRSLPRFAPRGRSFATWFRRHEIHPNAGRVGRVVLMDDCLTSFCEPHIPIASVELLERAGYAVELSGLWCCGRPFISKGFVEKGRSLARANVDRLVRFVEQGMPILGHEPSCLLTLVDEYPDLVPSDATRKVKENSFLLGGWIAERIEAGDVRLDFTPRNETALVHGHCQQKALVGTGAMNRALRLIPGLTVREVDSGCCGMAGSFGYDHFDISQQIGERVLFQEVRSHQDGLVIAPGFSCRHQIADGTGVEAIHPVVLLRHQLAEGGRD
jgi:Fe-S oxidoreductase